MIKKEKPNPESITSEGTGLNSLCWGETILQDEGTQDVFFNVEKLTDASESDGRRFKEKQQSGLAEYWRRNVGEVTWAFRGNTVYKLSLVPWKWNYRGAFSVQAGGSHVRLSPSVPRVDN